MISIQSIEDTALGPGSSILKDACSTQLKIRKLGITLPDSVLETLYSQNHIQVYDASKVLIFAA